MNAEWGVDYEMVPMPEHNQAWAIRILKGQFVETVIEFNNITFNKVEKGVLNFSFNIVSSPDANLTTENVDLQDKAGDILQSVCAEGIKNDSLQIIEIEKDE